MDRKTVKIPNIGCNGCVSTIQDEVSALPGVVSVEGNPDTQIITVQWDNPATWSSITNKLQEIDYAPAEA